MTKYLLVRPQETNVLLLELLDFPMETSNIAFTVKPTYRLCISYGAAATVTHSADYLLNTGTGVDLVRQSKLPRKWTHRIERSRLSTLCTAKKRPLP